MTEVLFMRNEQLKKNGEASYYDSDGFYQTIENSENDDTWTGFFNKRHKIASKSFVEDHPDFSIGGFHIDEEQQVNLTEYAPILFRNIRKKHITEENFYRSFVPSKNFEGLFNFKRGAGKSPSFFFFTDNNLLMLKTLKESEFDILINKKTFLMDYFKYVINNPDCLLSKIFGIFKI